MGESMPDTVLQQTARFITKARGSALPEEVLEIAKRALIDYLGCAIAGSGEAVSTRSRNWAEANTPGGTCTLFGRTDTLDPVQAAFCNAVSGHALDFDDTSWATIGHPTAVAAPVALALGEAIQASGLAVLNAYVIGVEASHKIAGLTMPKTSEIGWHTTGVFGTPMAAAVQGCLGKSDETTLTHGLGIALTRAAGFRSNFGSMTKPLHAGLAAKSGMEAMALAEDGITSSLDAFEAADGFTSCFGGKPGELPFGAPWDLLENGLAFKRYPCCSGTHPAVDVLLEWRAACTVAPEEIREIRVGTSLLSPRELVNSSPRRRSKRSSPWNSPSQPSSLRGSSPWRNSTRSL